jgi:hypothetical protein
MQPAELEELVACGILRVLHFRLTVISKKAPTISIDRALQFLAAVGLLQDFEKVAVIICPQGTVCR